MSGTAIIFVLLFTVGVYLTLKHPFWGVALYIFEWHNHPPYMWWGDPLPDFRWSLLVSLITLLSLIINHGKLKQLKDPKYNLIWWLVGMTAWMYFVSVFFAINPKASFKRAENFLKMTIQIFLMMQLIREVDHHKKVIWTLIFSVANFGRVAWQRGGNRYIGVTAPNATEENAISAHVAAILPFFGLYALTGKRWQKIFTILSVPFLINLLILANSRASFLAVVIIAILSIFWIKGRLRWYVILASVAGVIMFLMLAGDQFWERQSTIQDYEQDGSAMSRIYLWNGAIEMWKDHPAGAGGKAFTKLVMDYVPELVETMQEKGAKTVHSTFFLLLVEWGPIGIILYFGFTIHMFFILARVRKRSPETPGYHYYVDAMAIQLGIIGLFFAGLTHNRVYSEVYYWFGAFTVVLRNLQVDELLTPPEERDYDLEDGDTESVII